MGKPSQGAPRKLGAGRHAPSAAEIMEEMVRLYDLRRRIDATDVDADPPGKFDRAKWRAKALISMVDDEAYDRLDCLEAVLTTCDAHSLEDAHTMLIVAIEMHEVMTSALNHALEIAYPGDDGTGVRRREKVRCERIHRLMESAHRALSAHAVRPHPLAEHLLDDWRDKTWEQRTVEAADSLKQFPPNRGPRTEPASGTHTKERVA